MKNQTVGMKPVVTPGVAELESDEGLVDATANCLGIDRLGMQCASK